jgi:hypothetical protein
MLLQRHVLLLAMILEPLGPWYTEYIPAITDNNTWAVQIFEVALSRLYLLTSLQRHTQGTVSISVLLHNDSSRHTSFILFFSGEKKRRVDHHILEEYQNVV